MEAIRESLFQEEEEETRCMMMRATHQDNKMKMNHHHHLPTGVLSHGRIQAQKSFVKAFLAQQEEHKQYGIQDARGLYQFSKSLTKDSKRRAMEDAKSLAFDCQRDEAKSSRELVMCIDNVLDILDIPLPMDTHPIRNV